MSLLTMIQEVAEDLGITVPTAVIGNSSSDVTQLLALANREGRDLASRYRWSKLLKENTFTFATAKDQGELNGTVVDDGDVDYILNDTIWDRTENIPICGPMSPILRQAHEAFSVAGPYPRYYLRGKNLFFDVVPSANTGAFEYKSTWWCESSGGNGQAKWEDDTDVGRLDENLMGLGITWRWLRRKGFDYAEEMRTYEMRIKDAMAQDATKRVLSLDYATNERMPGIFVPEGNWLQ